MALVDISLDTAAHEEPYQNPLARVMSSRPLGQDVLREVRTVVLTRNGNRIIPVAR